MLRKSKVTRNSRPAYLESKQPSFLPMSELYLKLPPKNTFAYTALKTLLAGKRVATYIFIKLGWPVMVGDFVVNLNEEPKQEDCQG